ncbi:hypothetical protein V500_11053 [Pseudogymnoascus sp. VKM F-4518 (FW-2643)]|nr:hypothetical protein V500_11053 [Pseudogymnoascus sp. VKM F-4518 (FW-2643)]
MLACVVSNSWLPHQTSNANSQRGQPSVLAAPALAASIPASADAEARHLLSIQAEYELSSPHEAKTLRQSVVAAAEELTVSIRMAAQRRPKTTEETNLALLRGQEEMIGLLHRIEAKLTAQGREEKRKGKGKGRD